MSVHTFNDRAFELSQFGDLQTAQVSRAPLQAPLHALNPLRDSRWRAFVEEHPRASVFHKVSWLDALRRTYGYQPVVYTTSPPDEALQNGIVFCRVESRITGRRLVSLPFSDHCEPLIDRAEDLERIIRYLQPRVASGDWKYVELRPTSDAIPRSIRQEFFQPLKRYYLHTIDLRPQENELFRRLHESSVQRRIRRATREGLRYESGRSDVLQGKFYELLVLTRRRHHTPPQPEEWFRNLVACMGDAIEIHIASHGNKPVAAILTLQFKNAVTYKYGGSDLAYKKFGSMPFLLWRAMQAAKSNGVEVFDLGRTDLDDHGLIAFKDHWASVRTELTYWRFPAPTQGHFRSDVPGLELAKNIFRILPTSMLKLAGQILYRHIG
jgi:CelD/BcsL family acetyltransferase involved in cellulose biosynthesis